MKKLKLLLSSLLCEMAGISGYQEQSYEYIQAYVKDKEPKATMKAINEVLSLVEQIVSKVVAASKEA